MNIYDYQRLVGKIEDAAELRDQFIQVFDTKTKLEMAKFGLAYSRHVHEITGFSPDEETLSAFEAVQEWIDGKVNYHKARNIAFTKLYKEVKDTNNIIKKRFMKTLAQLSCIPHVKAHGLWATDMAITLINAMYPNNVEKVIEERLFQITLLKSI